MSSVDRAEAKVEEIQRLRGLYMNMKRQITSLVPSTMHREGKRYAWFSGDSRHLTFQSTLSIWGQKEGLFEVTYRVEEGPQGLQLVEEERLPGEEEGLSVVVLDGIDEAAFSFFDRDYQWTQDFTEPRDFPLLVSLYIRRGEDVKNLIFPVYARPLIVHNPPKIEGDNIFDALKEFIQ